MVSVYKFYYRKQHSNHISINKSSLQNKSQVFQSTAQNYISGHNKNGTFYRPAHITSRRNNKVGLYGSAGLHRDDKDGDQIDVDALTTNSSHSRLSLGFNYRPLIKFIGNTYKEISYDHQQWLKENT